MQSKQKASGARFQAGGKTSKSAAAHEFLKHWVMRTLSTDMYFSSEIMPLLNEIPRFSKGPKGSMGSLYSMFTRLPIQLLYFFYVYVPISVLIYIWSMLKLVVVSRIERFQKFKASVRSKGAQKRID